MKPIEISISKRIRVYTVYKKLCEQGFAEVMSSISQQILLLANKILPF